MPAPPAPGSAAIERRGHQLRNVEPSLSRGRRRAMAPELTRGCVFGSARAGQTYRWRSLSHLRARPAEASRLRGTEDPSSRGAPTPRGYEPRTPFIERSVGRRRASSALFRRPPRLPRLGRRGAASDTHFARTRCALGPREVSRYSQRLRGPHAVLRLLQSRRSVSTPKGRSNSNTYTAACHRWSDDLAREGTVSRAFTGQGPRAFRSRFRPPPERPLAPTDLPQPARPEHPMSQIHVEPLPGSAAADARAVTWALGEWIRQAPRASRAVCR